MAGIKPIKALRFTEKAGNIADCVCPPYDIISESEREALIAKNENNVVRLELSGKTKAIVYVDGNPIFAPLKDGVLDLNISCGDGVFIIPIE